MDLITVIIPVYNIENYLEKCVYSVMNQTYRNLQIILVDDGSVDSSGKICDELALKDQRIQVIHKENGGPSDARNTGINLAEGKYIGFVDGDDYIDNDMYEALYTAICKTHADIASCGIHQSSIYGDVIKCSKEVQVLDRLQAYATFFMQNDAIDCSSCNKLFKKTIFETLRFKKGIQSEDLEFLYRAFDMIKLLVCIDEVKYHYIYREGSRSGKPLNENSMATIKIFDDMMLFISEKYPSVVSQGYAYQLQWLLNLLGGAYGVEDKKKRKSFVQILNRKIFQNARNYWRNSYIYIGNYILFIGAFFHMYLPTTWLLKESVKIYHFMKGKKQL